MPKILIADEPCHGLDITNKAKVLEVFERITRSGTNLIYVTHRLEEIIPSITHILSLDKGSITQQKISD